MFCLFFLCDGLGGHIRYWVWSNHIGWSTTILS